MTVVAVTPRPTTGLPRGLNATTKAGLLLLLISALLHPDLGNMRDKAAWLRAIAYPLLAFTIPALWFALWRDRTPFPWVADLLVTLTCFSDILGNRMDLYDTVVWFDDWMHFANTGLIAAAVILLTLPTTASLAACLERALAFGVTAAVGWEIAEYFAFLSRSELSHTYADTLGDLAVGTLGAVAAAVAVHALHRRGRLSHEVPVLSA